MASIAIDARKYFDYGIGSYIQNLASALSGMGSKHSYTLLASSSDIARITEPEGWRKAVCDEKKYSIGEIARLGRRAMADGCELFHEPHYTLPSGLQGRSVVTIHDLIHLKFPQLFSPMQRLYAGAMIRYAVNNAGAVIAVSQRTKDDIIERFGVAEESVHVVHNGVRPSFRRLSDNGSITRFRNSQGLEKPYLLYVGNVKPHKNIPTLLRAFAGVRSRFPELNLVFAGGSCLRDSGLETLSLQLGCSKSIRDLGQLSEPDLVTAYNGADVVVLPSLYEGFGFPALEAMACGVPVVVSNGGALPEVVGDAAIVVEATQHEQFSAAILELLENSEKRSELIQSGLARAAGFTWEKAGTETLRIYEKVLGRWSSN